MATLTYDYRVTITFDLSYSKNPDYRYMNAYLEEKGLCSLKSVDEHLPSNIYTGTIPVSIETAGPNPTFRDLKLGADKAVRNTYESIKKNAETAGLIITLYVQASLDEATSSRKSRE
ncbi:hypothetical protein [Enterobacter sp. Lyrl_3]|uniref:hypothetical protein n=1 Tax=Enterobacter sp. Lyrl_3 TaxID=3110922 RepID=UPI003F822A29